MSGYRRNDPAASTDWTNPGENHPSQTLSRPYSDTDDEQKDHYLTTVESRQLVGF
ncbi:MAG: hypothetical protein HC800_15200 [Phormidesmis sp. RL_2_1]|nr:hypothetical protein [Phormidesmis sp. RL_2_1]